LATRVIRRMTDSVKPFTRSEVRGIVLLVRFVDYGNSP
jgi:hypothetical protein